MRRFVTTLMLSGLVIVCVLPAVAGGLLESFDITGELPSPVPGHLIARVIGIKWDTRSIPVQYRVNDTLPVVPNPLGTPFLTVGAASTTIQQSLNAWNNVATSFIDMNVVGTVANPGLRGFDFINEVTFRTAAGFPAIASSPSVSLISDVTFAEGDDIDEDGDSDVSASIKVVTDVDGDGDLEFPAGFYKAGTILDNDVQFNTKTSNGLRFTTADAEADTNTRSIDLMGVAVHEFGHSIGLSHDMNNQISEKDGTGTTMFPFVDSGDPASELASRTLYVDDMAWSSYIYPEGTAKSGPAALQGGDVAFKKAFGIISGKVHHGVLDQPIAGASVSAQNLKTGAVIASAFSGTTQLSFDPATGELFVVDPAFNIVNGNYNIPAPKGTYHVAIEPVDGTPGAPEPAFPGSISFTTQIGAVFGQNDFNEQFFTGEDDDDGDDDGFDTRWFGNARSVRVDAGEVERRIDFVTNRAINVNFFGNRNANGFTGATPGRYYAVRIPASVITSINPGEDILVKAISFLTTVADSSVPAKFAEAMLTTGLVNADGTATVNLKLPLARTSGFLGQDSDFAPFHFKFPWLLGKIVRFGTGNGLIQNLFLVLRVPTTTPFPGVSGFPPLIGLDGPTAATPVNDAPLFGLSYVSDDGLVFRQRTNAAGALDFNFMFSLVLAEAKK